MLGLDTSRCRTVRYTGHEQHSPDLAPTPPFHTSKRNEREWHPHGLHWGGSKYNISYKNIFSHSIMKRYDKTYHFILIVMNTGLIEFSFGVIVSDFVLESLNSAGCQ